MKIDAHHHLWQPKRGDYAWMPKDNATLRRAYAPADLAPHIDAFGIDGAVIVPAGVRSARHCAVPSTRMS